MTPRNDIAASVMRDAHGGIVFELPDVRPGNVIRLSGDDFGHARMRAERGQSTGKRHLRAVPNGKIDAGRTVRSGMAFDLDSIEPVSLRDAKRAAAIRAELGDEPLQGIERRYAYRFAKRAFDIAFSAAVLTCFSWLYAAVAIAVKLDDPTGPTIFKQKRIGKDGREFTMYKFRSMCADAEDRLAELQALNEKTGPVFKIADDPRVTRVGRVIRKLSLDELPQFVNVLRGDMSVIGPRPALPNEVRAYTGYQRQRLLVRGGLSCYWQTRKNRDTITFDEWVDLDLLYIRKCGVWTDLKLLVQTVGVVLTAQGS